MNVVTVMIFLIIQIKSGIIKSDVSLQYTIDD